MKPDFKSNGMTGMQKTEPDTRPHTGGWQHKLQGILDRHNTMKVSGRGNTSYRTREKRTKMLFQMFHTLRGELNFQIEDPENLKVKHVESLAKFWIEEKLSPGTIDNNLSVLRTLCTWMGKPGMVKSLNDYAPGMRRVYAAQKDKSWTGNDVDFWPLWDKVYAKSKFVGMQLLLVGAFGARRAEAVNFKPLLYAHEHYIELVDGTKGGRPRIVEIDDDFKRSVIATLKNFVSMKGQRAKGHTGHPDKTLEQNIEHYSYVLRSCGISKGEIGVTGHGLRVEFVIDELEKRGLIATIRGGTGQAETKLQTDVAYHQVSEAVGHSRKGIITAYSGGLVAKLLKTSRPAVVSEAVGWKQEVHKRVNEGIIVFGKK